MFGKRKDNKKIEIWEKILEEELEKNGIDDDFCISDDIEGYERCEGFNREKCLSDCLFTMMMPTISSTN